MVGRKTQAENLLLPIGRGLTKQTISLLANDARHILLQLRGRHHIEHRVVVTHAHATRIRYLNLARALLGGDDNHTIRSTRTIDSRSRSVLQDGERCDIVGIDHRQAVTDTYTCTLGDGHTIDDDKRVVVGRE